MTDVSLACTIEKADKTGRFASGWISVVEKDGKLVVDLQGDVWPIDEVRKTVHRFVRSGRIAKVMHKGEPVGEMVQMVVIDDDFAKAHGITHTKRGWWGELEFTDPAVQKRVRDGELKGFSIGGKGKRTPLAKRVEHAEPLVETVEKLGPSDVHAPRMMSSSVMRIRRSLRRVTRRLARY